MTDILWADTETFSHVDIKRGTDRYSRAAQIMLFQYALNDGPVSVWDRTADPVMPADLSGYLADNDMLVYFHNARFDKSVCDTNGFHIAPHRLRCSMARALAHSLPGGLDKLCDIFGISEDKAKLKDGKALVKLFCCPQAFKHTLKRADFATAKEYKAAVEALREQWPGRATRHTHPEEWKRFIQYGANDIEAMRAVVKAMPKWNYGGPSPAARRETALWHLDQKINQRGVPIDTALVDGAIVTADRTKATLAEETKELTDGTISATTQRNALLELLNGYYELNLPDLRAATVERLLKSDVDLPAVGVSLLQNRLAASSTSVSKYEAFAKLTGPDGRLRNTLQFCGAMRTGRWAGRGVQLQNLPRPVLKNKAILAGIEAIKLDCADLIYDNPMELLSSSVRGCIIPSEGRKLVVADLSNIEGRMLAWLAGEEWKLNAFRDFDTCLGEDGNWYTGDQIRDSVLAGKAIPLKLDKKGEPTRRGHDLYALAYAKAFRITPEAVMENKKNGDGSMRQIGKVMELACFAADTKVITSNGVKNIVDVEPADLLWDGSEWVSHKGLVEKGVRPVVRVAGMKVTPDHQILTGNSWKPAGQLAMSESTLCRALETGSESLRCLALNGRFGGLATTIWSESSVLAERNPTSSMTTTCGKGNRPAATSVQRSSPGIGEKIFSGMQALFRMTISAGRCLTESLRASTDATTQRTRATPTMAAEGYTCTNRGARTEAPFLHTLSRSTVGTTTNLNSTERTSTRGTNQETCGSSQSRKTTPTVEKSAICKNESGNLNERIRTYDIAYSGPRNRFTVICSEGALVVHNCGYQGSVGAFATFAIAYGIDLDDMARNAISGIPADVLEAADRSYKWAADCGRDYGMSEQTYKVCFSFVRMWRTAHARTSAFWPALENAVRSAILSPNREYTVGVCKVIKTGNWLRLVLPSGRTLCYPAPRLDGENEKISYMGVNQFTRQWCRLHTYGGKLAENVTQAASRDVIGHSLPEIEDAGYDVLTTVHDEDITDAPDTDDFTAEHLAALMASNPEWAKGLPLAAAGFEDYRYRKD